MEIGQGVTHSAVVVEGQTVHHSVRRNDIGGSVLTDYMVMRQRKRKKNNNSYLKSYLIYSYIVILFYYLHGGTTGEIAGGKGS